MKKTVAILFLFFITYTTFSNVEEVKQDSIKYTISKDDCVLAMIDSVLADKYYNAFGF